MQVLNTLQSHIPQLCVQAFVVFLRLEAKVAPLGSIICGLIGSIFVLTDYMAYSMRGFWAKTAIATLICGQVRQTYELMQQGRKGCCDTNLILPTDHSATVSSYSPSLMCLS